MRGGQSLCRQPNIKSHSLTSAVTHALGTVDGSRHNGARLRLELSPHIALIVYLILKTELTSCSFDEDIRESNIFGPQGTVK